MSDSGQDRGALERLTLDQLRVWVCIVEEGSFSAAGRRLGKVQSAISQAVATLEDVLGVQVFDRSRRKVKLTPTGAALLPDVRIVLASVERVGGHAMALAGGVEPEFSLTCDAIFPTPTLAALCRELADAFEHVAVRTQTEVMGGVVQRVLDRECDLGIVGPAARMSDGLVRVELGSVRMIPVVAVSHRLAHAEATDEASLRDHVQIVLSERDASTPDQRVVSARTWRVGDLATKRALILEGLGWGNLPEATVADALEDGRLQALDVWSEDSLRLPLSAIHRRDHGLGPVARRALETLRGLCGGLSL